MGGWGRDCGCLGRESHTRQGARGRHRPRPNPGGLESGGAGGLGSRLTPGGLAWAGGPGSSGGACVGPRRLSGAAPAQTAEEGGCQGASAGCPATLLTEETKDWRQRYGGREKGLFGFLKPKKIILTARTTREGLFSRKPSKVYSWSWVHIC